jgi:NAD(P)-dependent dehydrogenase (short-subunit alcohol dehydrogenase family)
MAEWSVRGKRVLITGATNGIGLAGAAGLASLGADLAIVARSEARAAEAVAAIEAAGEGRPVDVLMADLSSQRSVRALAAEALERYPRIDVLINNAGAIYTKRELTEEGVELTWAVNHLAPFLLTNLLLDRLKASAPARVITTTSDAHRGARTLPFDDFTSEKRYGGVRRYGETKLANILFTAELARRLSGTGVTANCYHPGFVRTGWNRNNGIVMRVGMAVGGRLLGRSPAKGADTMVWLADSADVADETGGYFFDRKRRLPTPIAQDMDVAAALWEASEEQTQTGAAAGG